MESLHVGFPVFSWRTAPQIFDQVPDKFFNLDQCLGRIPLVNVVNIPISDTICPFRERPEQKRVMLIPPECHDMAGCGKIILGERNPVRPRVLQSNFAITERLFGVRRKIPFHQVNRQPSRKCRPAQSFMPCHMVEHGLRKSAPVVVASANKKNLQHPVLRGHTGASIIPLESSSRFIGVALTVFWGGSQPHGTDGRLKLRSP